MIIFKPHNIQASFNIFVTIVASPLKVHTWPALIALEDNTSCALSIHSQATLIVAGFFRGVNG